VPWSTFSTTGVFGDAGAATPEKGRALIERWLEVMTRIVSDGFAERDQSNPNRSLEAIDAT
jgi:creatinine amidohydrolase/Fe(II)-dependent formamide hydrolase-like protein